MGNPWDKATEAIIGITWSEPDTFETDFAAIRAAAAGPILLNLQGVDLGYAYGARHGIALTEKLRAHGRLDTDNDEGYKIRGYLYLIEFDNGAIKYGFTADPISRINKHVKGLCSVHSLKINRLWLSVPTLLPQEVESKFRQHSTRWSDGTKLERQSASLGESEVAYDMDFDAMLTVARRLAYTPITKENTNAVLAERRRNEYTIIIRTAVDKWLRENGDLDGFVLPVTKFDGPTTCRAPLSYFDLTTTDGLWELANPHYQQVYRNSDPELVEVTEEIQRVGLTLRVARMFRGNRKAERKLIRDGENEMNTLKIGDEVVAVGDFGGILRRRIPAGSVGRVVQSGLGQNLRVSFIVKGDPGGHFGVDEQVVVTVKDIDPVEELVSPPHPLNP